MNTFKEIELPVLTLEICEKNIDFYMQEMIEEDKKNPNAMPSSSGNQYSSWLKAKQLLEEGWEIREHAHGYLVNNKFIVAAQQNKWRVNGKNKWYWHGKISSLHKYFDK